MAKIPRCGMQKSPSIACFRSGPGAPASTPRILARLSATDQINRGIPVNNWPFGVQPVRFIRPVPSSHRAAVPIVESTDRFPHHEEGMALAAAFIILVAGVGANQTSQMISPGASTPLNKRCHTS